MHKRIVAIGMALLLEFFGLNFGYAQQASSAPTQSGPHRQLATIIYAGLGGSILGLSTLSFYGKPQEKLANIAIGFALGIIVGTVYVTYEAATHPADFYGQDNKLPEEILKVAAQNHLSSPAPGSQVGPFMYTWRF